MSKALIVKGKTVLIDDGDYSNCLQFKWRISVQGYVWTTDKTLVYLHRYLIGAKSGEIVDHINGNPLDNRRTNLRIVTPAQNSMNKRIRLDNKSGHTGVSWSKAKQKWLAYIHYDKKMVYLGAFNTKDEAIEIRTKSEHALFGEYARGALI